MKQSPFIEEQIILFLSEHETGVSLPIYAASIGSAMRPFANGRPDLAALPKSIAVRWRPIACATGARWRPK